ncbi:hypothetical protein HPB48_019574 [Haemaphysalis longicornis]|uniref:Uncharacterized protein n=1 Tax=Haemaphysalis longicornis TaxID=44386 RepID=A0A9J6FG21_HAELO|nr:hypothetical protein HPB48_019574 [Haemaphysalis longicornis]
MFGWSEESVRRASSPQRGRQEWWARTKKTFVKASRSRDGACPGPGETVGRVAVAVCPGQSTVLGLFLTGPLPLPPPPANRGSRDSGCGRSPRSRCSWKGRRAFSRLPYRNSRRPRRLRDLGAEYICALRPRPKEGVAVNHGCFTHRTPLFTHAFGEEYVVPPLKV